MLPFSYACDICLGRNGAVHYCKDILLFVCSQDGTKQLTFLLRELISSFLCIKVPSPLIPKVSRSPLTLLLCLAAPSHRGPCLGGRASDRGLQGPAHKSTR